MTQTLAAQTKVTKRQGLWQSAAIWMQALRCFSLPLSVVPVLFGTLLAAYDGRFAPGLFLLTLLGTVAIHTGANLANNYYDFARGLDSGESLGPARLISQGRVSPRAIKNAMILAFTTGIVSGLAIVARAGWPVLAIGLLSIAVAYFYSAGPRPLAYAGLGEVLVFTFLGMVVLEGSYFVQAQGLSLTGLWVSAILGMWATCILVLNDIRDRERDRRAGKRTFAVVAGTRWSEVEFATLAFGSFGLVMAGVAANQLSAATLLAVLALPWTVRIFRTLRGGVGGWALTRLQGRVALNYFGLSALIAVAIAL